VSAENLDAVKRFAKDLRSGKPRSPKDELAGFQFGWRALDKCRATILGWNGEYQFNCPMDQKFFAASRIDAEEFKRFVATGADDESVEVWVGRNVGK
jgi:hypothetical protein